MELACIIWKANGFQSTKNVRYAYGSPGTTISDRYWFHVHGMPGSHVLLRARAGEKPDRKTLKEAAAIAAFHSKARKGGVVPVSCTLVRYATKPRDAKPGTVRIRKETVLKVRPNIPEV